MLTCLKLDEKTGNTGWAGPGFGPGPCHFVTENTCLLLVQESMSSGATSKSLLSRPQIAQNEKLTFHEQVECAL